GVRTKHRRGHGREKLRADPSSVKAANSPIPGASRRAGDRSIGVKKIAFASDFAHRSPIMPGHSRGRAMMLRRFVRVRSWLAPLAALFLLVPALARAASQGSAQPGALTLASVSGTGQKGNGGSFEPKLSDDGTKVAFWSSASNLTPLDNDNSNDIFVKSLTDGSVTLASTSISGVKGNSDSLDASISGDGNLVAFTSEANNLSPAD